MGKPKSILQLELIMGDSLKGDMSGNVDSIGGE